MERGGGGEGGGGGGFKWLLCFQMGSEFYEAGNINSPLPPPPPPKKKKKKEKKKKKQGEYHHSPLTGENGTESSGLKKRLIRKWICCHDNKIARVDPCVTTAGHKDSFPILQKETPDSDLINRFGFCGFFFYSIPKEDHEPLISYFGEI